MRAPVHLGPATEVTFDRATAGYPLDGELVHDVQVHTLGGGTAMLVVWTGAGWAPVQCDRTAKREFTEGEIVRVPSCPAVRVVFSGTGKASLRSRAETPRQAAVRRQRAYMGPTPALVQPIPIALDLALGAPGVTAEAASAGPAPDLSVALQADGSCYLEYPVAAGNYTPWVDNDWTIIVREATSGGPAAWVIRPNASDGWQGSVEHRGYYVYLCIGGAGGHCASVRVENGAQVSDHVAATLTFGARELTATLGVRSTSTNGTTSWTPGIHRQLATGGYSVVISAAGALWWRTEIYNRKLTEAEQQAVAPQTALHPIDAASAAGEDVSDALVHIYQAADRYDSGGGTMVVPDQWGTGGLATLLAGTADRFIASAWPY